MRIDQVRLQGVLATAALHRALSGVKGDDPPAGRCLGGRGITILVQRLQEALLARGYLTSRVVAPEQNLKSGVLVLRIVEGRIARVRAAPPGEALPRLAWTLHGGDIFNLHDLEQSSENLLRLPSLQSRIRIEPGEATDTSDIVASMNPQRPVRLGLALDNDGLRSTGRLQGNLSATWDNPLGLADFCYVSMGQSLGAKGRGPRGNASRIVHYSLPWGYWMLGATLSDNRNHQTVFGPYESYRYAGKSSQVELSLQRVVHRNGRSKTTASARTFLRRANNYIGDLEVMVQRRRTAGWELGVQHLHHLSAGTLNVQLAYRRGTAAFGAEPAPEEATGQGSGRMRLVTGWLNWAMPMHCGRHLWQYSSQWQAQWSTMRLTPQDRFCLGGRATVRGFDGEQTLCGDRGQLWRQELSTALPTRLAPDGGIQAYAALDTGRATRVGHDDTLRLTGMSVGLRGQYLVADAYPLQWEAFVGHPVSKPEGFITARFTAGFNIRVTF